MLTWRRMFSVLVQYIRLYNPPDQLEGAGAGGTAGAGVPGVVPQRTADFVLPACDSLALCAYLRLFRWVGLAFPGVKQRGRRLPWGQQPGDACWHPGV